MMRVRCGRALGPLLVSVLAAFAQMRRADFATLIGDTGDTIRLAKLVKDCLVSGSGRGE